MISRTGAEIRASEQHSKFMQDRITHVEKGFGDLCNTFSSYTRKTARLRDKGDLICKGLIDLVSNDTLNPTTKSSVTHFAEELSSLQDYRQAQVSRLESRVVQPLSSYGLICKDTKIHIRAATSAIEKEQKSKIQVEKVRQKNPGNTHQISQAVTAHQKASITASRSSKDIEQKMESFEKQKLADLKKALTEFVHIEMLFHAKALEVYTQCFSTLGDLDTDQDIEEFKRYLNPASASPRHTLARSASKNSLNTTGQSYNSVDSREKTPSTGRRNNSKPPQARTPVTGHKQLQHSMQPDDEDYDDDDDDDESDIEDDEISDEPPSPRTPQVKVTRVK